jgi:hypothetical protein
MKHLLLSSFIVLLFLSCKKEDKPEDPISETPSVYADINNTFAFGILDKIKGIWNGPVSSTTALGSYPEWIVDFRPNGENQISAKNELDTLNDIFMSFFVVKYKGEYRVAFRNGGSFAGMKRVSYLLADSVSELSSHSYYRFSEIIKGKNRAYSEVIFRADSVYLKSYTNIYNTEITPVPHMTWSAKLQDLNSSQTAVSTFSFPKKTLCKDFSNSFTGMEESMFFSTSGNPTNDPYSESSQPYLGQTNAQYTFLSSYSPNPSKKVFLLLTTQPLFSGFSFDLTNLKYRSRYVILNANDTSFTFNYMHPGEYYYYAFYDNDGNGTINSGDWISTSNTTFSLAALGTSTTTTQINFTIP